MSKDLDKLEGIDWERIAPAKARCPKCKQKFETKGELLCHRPCFLQTTCYKASSSHRFRCPGHDGCNIKTRNLKDLQHHLNSTLIERQFVCRHCDKAFGKKDKLFDHIEKIHYRMYCTIKSCVELLDSAPKMRLHLEEVHDARVSECDHCHQIFTTWKGLLQHVRHKHTPDVVHDAIQGRAATRSLEQEQE